MKFSKSCVASFLAILCSTALLMAEDNAAKNPLLEVRQIWDKAPHNAFTDLMRFNGRWYCAFREGQAHAGGIQGQGKLRVIASEDGKAWESVALFASELGDMRDGKLSVTADGQLMLASAMQIYKPAPHRHQSLTWLSPDGKKWSKAHQVGDPNNWIWGVSWHNALGYGIGYNTVNPKLARLFRTPDGRKFEPIVPNLKIADAYPNESCIVFAPDETAFCLLRCGGPGQIGQAKPPYTDWTWKKLGASIGGPEMIQLGDGRLLAAVRLYDGKVRTALCWIDAKEGAMTETLTLPSGGDTSYAGMVMHDVLWISYYSSHEVKSKIYLAKVDAAALKE